jgi:hypothetical protein
MKNKGDKVMEHLEMIISYEDLEKNRKKKLIADRKKEKEIKKQTTLGLVAVGILFIEILFSMIVINNRLDEMYKQKCANEPTTQIAQNNQR